MRETRYYPGTMVRLTATFRDPDTKALSDVTAPVNITIEDPAGIETTVVATRLSTGTYRALRLVSLKGMWKYRAVSSGAEPVAIEGAFEVLGSSFV